MRNSTAKIFFVRAVLVILSCHAVSAEKAYIHVSPGTNWKMRAPQIAIWVEESDGKFKETVFVTKSAAGNCWKFSPKTGRPDSLPVWYAASGIRPCGKKILRFDALSSSTPRSGLVAGFSMDFVPGGRYTVRLEVNQSFDYNGFYTKRNSGVNGQPSCVYRADFSVPEDGSEMKDIFLLFEGVGAVDGADGDVHSVPESSITTAADIVRNVYITFRK